MQYDEINNCPNNFLEKKSIEIKTKVMSLQFVQDCSDVKKLVCLIEQNCGYLCQLYSVNVCYIAASYQNRTVTLKYLDYFSLEDKQKQNDVFNLNRFTDIFLPITNCELNINETLVDISGK